MYSTTQGDLGFKFKTPARTHARTHVWRSTFDTTAADVATALQELAASGMTAGAMARCLELLAGAMAERPPLEDLVDLVTTGPECGGVSNRDTGSQTGPYLAPGMDSIAEVKVLLSNYQAEYGRSSGGAINVVIKSGSKQWHGGGFLFARNEALNANGFFYNRDGLPRAPYRFTSPGSACRPRAFLLKMSSPFTVTSNTPPSEGNRVIDWISGSKSCSNSATRPVARLVYPQTAQYLIVISSMRLSWGTMVCLRV